MDRFVTSTGISLKQNAIMLYINPHQGQNNNGCASYDYQRTEDLSFAVTIGSCHLISKKWQAMSDGQRNKGDWEDMMMGASI